MTATRPGVTASVTAHQLLCGLTMTKHFMVMRMMHGHGDPTMETVATLGENATEYHDANIESGMTYMYEVAAMNDSGESDSNQIEIAAP